jgi:hypothetical protein
MVGTAFATDILYMTRHPWTRAAHLLEHTATVMVGFVLVVLGLGLTFSIVFLIPGIIVLFLGICLVVGGIFAHPARRRRGEASR